MKRTSLTFAAVAIALGFSGQSRAASILTNGGFETGDLSGWTSQHWFVANVLSGLGKSPSEGFYYASTGCTGDSCINGAMDQQAYLYQDVTTIPGEQYTLSFDFQSDEDPTELVALFDGKPAFDLTGLGYQLGYTTYTGTFTATGTTARLMFLGRDDPSYFGFDNVSLMDTGINTTPVTMPMTDPTPTPGATPEPSTWLLAFGGAAAAWRFRRR